MGSRSSKREDRAELKLAGVDWLTRPPVRHLRRLLGAGLFLLVGLALSQAASAAADLSESIHVFRDFRKDPAATVYVAVLGDFGVQRSYIEALDAQSRLDLQRVREYLESKDVVVGNFEWMYPEEFEFTARFIQQLGIDAMGLANNHAGDHGDEVLELAAQALTKQGVAPIGLDNRPYLETVKKGQLIRVLAAAGNFDHPTQASLSVHDPEFETILKDFLSRGDVHILSGHLGLSPFIDEYEVSTAKKFLSLGCDAVVLHSTHFPEGFLEIGEGAAVVSPGDFLFPQHVDRRHAEFKPSTIPVLGFEDGRWVYYEVLVFLSEVPNHFRLADAAMRDNMVSRLLSYSDLDFAKGYAREDTRIRTMDLLKAGLDPRNLGRVRPHHIKHLLNYVYYNHRASVLALSLSLIAGCSIYAWLWARRRRLRDIGDQTVESP